MRFWPLSRLTWRDTLEGVVKDKLTPVAWYVQEIRTPGRPYRLPSVVALKTYIDLDRRVALTRYNLFLAHDLHCAYCGETFVRSEEHTSELQSLMRTSYAVFCLQTQKNQSHTTSNKCR